jgi:hypothetical protein
MSASTLPLRFDASRHLATLSTLTPAQAGAWILLVTHLSVHGKALPHDTVVGLLGASAAESIRHLCEVVTEDGVTTWDIDWVAKERAHAAYISEVQRKRVIERWRRERLAKKKSFTPPSDRPADEPAKAPKAAARPAQDPRVDDLMTHFRELLGASLDGSVQQNRRDCAELLQRMEADYPDRDAADTVKTLLQVALQDQFHRKNTTHFGYLLKYAQKIIQSYKTSKANPNGKRSAVSDLDAVFAARAAGKRG